MIGRLVSILIAVGLIFWFIQPGNASQAGKWFNQAITSVTSFAHGASHG